MRLSATAEASVFLARLFGQGDVAIGASAVVMNQPLAQLAGGSGLIAFDSSRSAATNALFTSLLGRPVSLSAASYQGLVDTNVPLFDVLDNLATSAGVADGDYDALLASTIGIGQLIDAMSAAAGSAGAGFTTAMTAARVAMGDVPPTVLGDIIGIEVDRPERAAGARVNVLSLLEGAVEAANRTHGLTAQAAMTIAGGTATLYVAAIEPRRVSAIGGVGIRVETAQVRILLNASLTNLLSLLGNALTVRLPVYNPARIRAGGSHRHRMRRASRYLGLCRRRGDERCGVGRYRRCARRVVRLRPSPHRKRRDDRQFSPAARHWTGAEHDRDGIGEHALHQPVFARSLPDCLDERGSLRGRRRAGGRHDVECSGAYASHCCRGQCWPLSGMPWRLPRRSSTA